MLVIYMRVDSNTFLEAYSRRSKVPFLFFDLRESFFSFNEPRLHRHLTLACMYHHLLQSKSSQKAQQRGEA